MELARAFAEPTEKGDRQRVAKLMARVGLCSRREAEAWILDGRVSVNGAVLTSPALDVGSEDRVLVDDVPLPKAEKTRLFLFHKPGGLITTDHDPEGRETVFDYLHKHWPEGPRVVTVGRLDYNTEGLLLLTNDGGLARVLELPKTGWVRRYRVRAKGETNQAVLDALAKGVTVDGVDYAGIEAKLDRTQGANCWLTVGLREGKNREVKRVLEHIGLEVNRLIRLSFGPFQLLDLPEGHVEEIKTRVLRDQLGPALAETAGVDFAEAEPTAVIVAPTRMVASAKTAPRPMDRASRKRDPAPDPGRREAREAVPRSRGPRDRDDDEAVPQKRERPAAGPRRHVSTLRADRGAAEATGSRKRLERTDTTDRKNRVVAIERFVSKAPAEVFQERPKRGEPPRSRPRPERSTTPDRQRVPERRTPPDRDGAPGRRERSPRDDRRDRAAPDRHRESRSDAGSARPKEDRGSRSAQGKRVRIARSGGGPRDERRAREAPERSFAEDRPARAPSRGKPAAPPSARPASGRSAEARMRKAPRGRSTGDNPSAARPARSKTFAEKPSGGRSAAPGSSSRPAKGGPPGRGKRSSPTKPPTRGPKGGPRSPRR